MPNRSILLCAFFLVMAPAFAGETDQYLAWDLELPDAAAHINNYLNRELQVFIGQANEDRPTHPVRSGKHMYNRGFRPAPAAERSIPETEAGARLAEDFYAYLFAGLLSSRFKTWLKETDVVPLYPPREIGNLEYQRMSIYRGLSFPFVLPMARTVNVNGVHMGTDKLAHFLGFGRRYFHDFRQCLADGLTEEAAMEKVIRRGLFGESYFVGGLVDGIVSYADLEANFQGFLMARDLCGGSRPCVVRADGKWKQIRPIDIRPYITPEFDESYYPPRYQGLRRHHVFSVLEERYASKSLPKAAAARFARYGAMPSSYSKKVIARCREERGLGDVSPLEPELLAAK